MSRRLLALFFLGAAAIFVLFLASFVFSVNTLADGGDVDVALLVAWLQAIVSGVAFGAVLYSLKLARDTLAKESERLNLISIPSKVVLKIDRQNVFTSQGSPSRRWYSIKAVLVPGIGLVHNFDLDVVIVYEGAHKYDFIPNSSRLSSPTRWQEDPKFQLRVEYSGIQVTQADTVNLGSLTVEDFDHTFELTWTCSGVGFDERLWITDGAVKQPGVVNWSPPNVDTSKGLVLRPPTQKL